MRNVDQAAIAFTMKVETQWGDTACIVGSSVELGAWIPAAGVRMTTDASRYPLWTADNVMLNLSGGGGHVEYKVVILRASGDVEWESMHGNRILKLVAGNGRKTHVRGEWNKPQQVTQEALEARIHASTMVTPLTADVMGKYDAIDTWYVRVSRSDRGLPCVFHLPQPQACSGSTPPKHTSPPLRAGPVPGSPSVSGAAVQDVGQPFSPIGSMEKSWPPSCVSSFKSHRNLFGSGVHEAGTLHRSRSTGSFNSTSRLDPLDQPECATRHSPGARPLNM